MHPTETRLHGWACKTRTQKCRGKISKGRADFRGSSQNSGHGDHSRLSWGAGDTQLGPGSAGIIDDPLKLGDAMSENDGRRQPDGGMRNAIHRVQGPVKCTCRGEYHDRSRGVFGVGFSLRLPWENRRPIIACDFKRTIRPHASLGYKPPAPEVFMPAFAAWPAALRRPAPPAPWRTPARTPGRYRRGSATKTSSTRCVTPSCRLHRFKDFWR
jgi:hypothetical protein